MDGWDALVAVISYIFGGLTVHLCYKYKKKTINHSGNIIGGNADISAGGDSVVAREYNKNIYVSGTPAKKIPELSKQANSIIIQLIENQSESFTVFEPVGKVEGITMIESRKEMVIEELLRVHDDLEALEANGYIRYCKPNSTGHIYALTPKGRDYGKKFLEENRGNTAK